MHPVRCRDIGKLLVIGLDGATFTVLNPLMRDGYLPHLKAMIESGGHGILQSTMPPFSASAWASFMTGKNPGKHGLFDFRAPVMTNPLRPLTNSTFIRSKTLWRILSDAGKKVVAINVPMTYPPESVNGVMIGGIMTPVIKDKCFYPPELHQKVADALGEYRPEPDWDAYRENGIRDADRDVIPRLVEEVTSLSQNRGEAGLFLLEEVDWDLFMIVFTSVDRLQHFAWKYLDPAYHDYDSKTARIYWEVLAGYYSALDDMIGKLIQGAGKDVHAIILSDHGFGPQYKKFYINNWLVEQGFLGLLETKRAWRKLFRRFDISRIRKLVPTSLERRMRRNFTVFNCIDWSRTKAYGGTSSEQGIFINVKGREPHGIVRPGSEYRQVVDEVCEKLDQLVDPATGERVVTKIFRRDELYWGPHVEFGPDIVFELKDMSYLTKENIGQHDLFESSGFESGSHRREGVLVMNGPVFKKGFKSPEASIVDVAPSILYSLGIPVDSDMDGRVLTDWFEEKFVEERPVRTRSFDADSDGSGRKTVYSDAESEEIESVLKGLGYL
ncbi:MAG: alkaline phosphatase family protein [Thermodesulfobacteriota bacterium]|nr:alkaline phosphatase family protein [Thermodesulfobacteriota bacterium]